MSRRSGRYAAVLVVILGLGATGRTPGQQVKLAERAPDPYGSPRPAREAGQVPPRTSLYLELAMPPEAKAGAVDPESVSLTLQPEGGEAIELLRPGRRFAEGATGWLRPKQDLSGARSLAVYLEPGSPLKPATRYTARVAAGPAGRSGTAADAGAWSFTTEASGPAHAVSFPLDLRAEPVRWHGRFFSGICNVIFCSQSENYGPTYDLMAEARKEHPRAWDYQRDFWPTGTEYRPAGFLSQRLPNIVRERETRRIAAMEPREGGLVLRVRDVFGHEQYGIPAGQPAGEDYHTGDEVLIADGVHDARTKVIAADSAAGTVTVAPVATPGGGWKIAYEGPLPRQEDPDAPGLFPPGGCYLRKYAPVGTACYYWGGWTRSGTWPTASMDAA